MRSERLSNLTLRQGGAAGGDAPSIGVRQLGSRVRHRGSPLGEAGVPLGGSSGQAVACAQVTDQLPGILDGDEEAHPAVVSHVEHCLRCQAELAQYRRLLRALHQLRVVGVEPPESLLSEVLAQLGDAAERGAIRSALTGRRVSYIAALAAAAGAAGVAGVAVVLANRGVSRGAGRGANAVRSTAKMPLAS